MTRILRQFQTKISYGHVSKIPHDDGLLSEPTTEVNGNDPWCKSVPIYMGSRMFRPKTFLPLVVSTLGVSPLFFHYLPLDGIVNIPNIRRTSPDKTMLFFPSSGFRPYM